MTNGGFFVHRTGLMDGNNEPIPASAIGSPVGATSFRDDFLPAPAPFADAYRRIDTDDGNYFTVGPALDESVDFSQPQYKFYQPDQDGNPKPIQGKPDQFEMKPEASMAGSFSHADQPNERAAMSQLTDVDPAAGPINSTMFHSYISARKLGLTMREWEGLVRKGVAASPVAGDGVEYRSAALDGGPSILVAQRIGGSSEQGYGVIDKGGKLEGGDPNKIRELPNMVFAYHKRQD